MFNMRVFVYNIQKATDVINCKDLFTCPQVNCLGFFFCLDGGCI